jgi:hypothetical protein
MLTPHAAAPGKEAAGVFNFAQTQPAQRAYPSCGAVALRSFLQPLWLPPRVPPQPKPGHSRAADDSNLLWGIRGQPKENARSWAE